MKNVRFKTSDGAMTKQIMHTEIFENGMKNSIVDNIESSNNPYLLMIANEKINISKPLTHSQVNNMVVVEAKRLVMNEKINNLRWKREQEFLETELKKFQNNLYVSRPKFNGLSQTYNNKQRFDSLINNDNELTILNKKINIPKIQFKECNNSNLEVVCNNKGLINYNCESKEQSKSLEVTGSITVVIKDKPIVPSSEENLEMVRWVFNSWCNYVAEIKRLRQLKIQIQQNVMTRKLRYIFNAWRNQIKYSKQLAAKKKEQCEQKDLKKIEIFVNMIKEKQKIPRKYQMNNKVNKNDELLDENVTLEVEGNENSGKNCTNVTEPLNNRLKVQKKIIAQQRMKLAEQNRLIEDMKLQQIEVESRMKRMETINLAKKIVNNCGSKSRKALMRQLIRQDAYENGDEKLVNQLSLTFPERLEARAVARRQKMQRRQIEREKKIYEEKLREETQKIEEEKFRKQHQRDVEREAKIIREEKERKKTENAEKFRIINELADNFYRKYLLRNYIMKPFILLVQISKDKMTKAARYYDNRLLEKTFNAWKNEVKQQQQIKLNLSIYTYNRNLLWSSFQQWRKVTKDEIRKYQVACDFYDLRLQEKYFNKWKVIMIEMQVKNNEHKKIAIDFHEKILKKHYFFRWKTYMEISDKVKESDKRRDQWRELVQMVIPDFAPKHRGVLIDD